MACSGTAMELHDRLPHAIWIRQAPDCAIAPQVSGAVNYIVWATLLRAYWRGGHFMTRLKAMLKDFSESYPRADPISTRDWRVVVRRWAACIMRQRVRYSMGERRTISLKRSANAVRDIPASLASLCRLHRSRGDWCIAAMPS